MGLFSKFVRDIGCLAQSKEPLRDRMERIEITEARRLALARAGLLKPEWTGFPKRASGNGKRARQAALQVIERFGYLQLDTVSVAGARSHAIVLLSRLEGFDPTLAEALLQRVDSFGGCPREIDNTAGDKRPSIINPHHYVLSVGLVDNFNYGIKWKSFMGSRIAHGIEYLTVRGKPPLEFARVIRGDAGF